MYLYANGSFYPYAIRSDYGDAWPTSGVDVEEETAAEFMGPPPSGKVRGTGADGHPIWVEAPAPVTTYADELAALNSAYVADRDALCAAWLRAAVADGMNEGERKADVEAELNELDAQHAVDVAALKTEYGVE